MYDITHYNVEISCEPLTVDELRNVLQTTDNWKSPGLDGVQNYWPKKLWCTLEKMTSFITLKVCLYFQSKDHNNREDPAQYRLITFLPTLYKVIISCIAQRIYSHCDRNNIIADQQKLYTKKSIGL